MPFHEIKIGSEHWYNVLKHLRGQGMTIYVIEERAVIKGVDQLPSDYKLFRKGSNARHHLKSILIKAESPFITFLSPDVLEKADPDGNIIRDWRIIERETEG